VWRTQVPKIKNPDLQEVENSTVMLRTASIATMGAGGAQLRHNGKTCRGEDPLTPIDIRPAKRQCINAL
jgi:hypothetical protein